MNLTVLSLGAGVQSTTLLLMWLHGEIEGKLDCAVFANTGWESQATYRHLEGLEKLAGENGLPIYRVSAGNIRDGVLQRIKTKRDSEGTPPYFLETGGMLPRNCTTPYKVRPILREYRLLLGAKKGQRLPSDTQVEQWLGISLDEYQRTRDNREWWITNRYPLIEKRMTRWDCLIWLQRHGYPEPPKSSCICCPYHRNAYWRDLRDNSPGEWANAAAFDRAIRHGMPGITCKCFLHRSMQPLDEVDLSTPEDHGQLSLFVNECLGLCGV